MSSGTAERPDPGEAYVCVGSVRGWCGVRHCSERVAWACCDADQRACAGASRGSLVRGYSDRQPHRIAEVAYSIYRGYYLGAR